MHGCVVNCLATRKSLPFRDSKLNCPSRVMLCALSLDGQSTLPDIVRSPDDTWSRLQLKGRELCNAPTQLLFQRAIMSGFMIAVGGVLAASVGFDTGVNPYLPGNGAQRFLCGAIGFPLSYILLSIVGGGSFTGDVFSLCSSYYKKDFPLGNIMKVMIYDLIGFLLGATAIALLATGSNVPALKPTVSIATYKLTKTLPQIFTRGVLGGLLICLSSFLSEAATTITGRVCGIWLPISTYVICDFEHFLSSFFFLLCGSMNGAIIPPLRFVQIIVASALGNFVGAIIMSSVGFVKLGSKKKNE
eukprot:gene10139-21143_t